MKFSKSTGCFYPNEFEYASIPDDAVEVFLDDYVKAMSLTGGETIDVINGKLVFIQPPEPDPMVVLQNAKAKALAAISAYAKAQRLKIAGTSDEGEIAGWSNKLRIAQSIFSGTATEAEIAVFQTEILARQIDGETLDIFVKKVFSNASFYSQAVSYIDGIKRRSLDLVNAATSPAEVDEALGQCREIAESAYTQLMMGVKDA
ncbi:hypothetical protein [Limnohabitans sp.]|uniref:hypothetical protein n=1 Tax=Limnohabitans sp. TaxID=1907725 RepID=UPI00286FA21C|nr:hypothetical protein [Limnohabitans sp.]